ncbi:TonB-dependent receptor [Hymenobacter arizonensis]|uniref:Outer membrane receptor proteins, mostly Fe transport n=1 Tax=Hymenobacter arizonensis TaxID=1227077 RepID=A0A1I6BJA7_HYMAR|nr:TonB-dependent receptor [Hymenobacter arizonensis]SFQ80877.1 Outer membrane receptor proteins, mostly Fe transport [Hymenobacter arizonensis]
MFKFRTQLLLVLCLFRQAPVLWAQQATPRYVLRGTVRGLNKAPLAGASVQLTRHPSAELVKVELSDEAGRFSFQNLENGQYQLSVMHYEYAVYQSGVLPVQQDTELPPIELMERVVNLKEVEVTAVKPFIEQHFDKTVLNVESSVTAAGNNTLEVLEKAPGLVIDQNDNISMRGREGVMVMIDGKRVPLSGAELANLLRTMPANSVEKIDLITNPSAKYDAAGNAGIIDIRLKKEKNLGTNGSISASLGQGKYHKSNSSLQLNHRSMKLNVFGTYGYNNRRDFFYNDVYRQFFEGNAFVGAYDQQNRIHTSSKGHFGRVGADYYLSPKTIVGLTFNGSFPVLGRRNISLNRSLVLDDQRQLQSYFLTRPYIRSERPNSGVNVNIKHTLDSTGREISANLDLLQYGTSEVQDFATTYYDANNEESQPAYLLHGDIAGELTIKSARVDYEQPWAVIKGTLEAGWKSSLVEADNNLQYFNRSNGDNELDPNISNHFLYRENINAAYVNANKKWGKASVQVGLRFENTNAEGVQLTDGQEFNRQYNQLFPSGFLGYQVNEQQTLGLSLSRRINRPTYSQLNPYISFIDPSTYLTGNPFLRPELSYAFELTHTFKDKIVTKLSYSRTDDVIVNVSSPAPNVDKVIVQQSQNLAQLNNYGLTVTLPLKAGKWLNSINNGSLYYSLYEGNLANTALRNGRPTFNLNSNNSIAISKDWSAELTGVYRSGQVIGFQQVKPIYFASAGVQKRLWDNKATLKLSVSDIFATNIIRVSTALTGYTENARTWRDTRVLTLGFTYRFGKNQVAPARKRTESAEEEKGRAG